MATNARHLETAEVAYSSIHEADKVHYIQYIKVLEGGGGLIAALLHHL